MADLITAMQAIFAYIMGLFGRSFEVLQENPILYMPIIGSLVGMGVLFAVSLIRRFGVRGLGSKRRRRRA